MKNEKKKVTRKEVAEKAGVSPSTVTRAINGNPSIPEITAKKILNIAKEMNYIPSRLARSFYQKKSFRIGIVIPFSDYHRDNRIVPAEYFSKTLYGAIVSSSIENYTVNIIADTGLTGKNLTDLVLSHSIDGILFFETEYRDRRFQILYDSDVPFILIHNYVKGKSYLYVDSDCRPGYEEAFQYIKSKGFTSVSFLGGDKRFVNAVDRENVFKKLAEENNIKILNILEGDFSRESGIQAAAIFKNENLPDVIFCANDLLAFGLIHGLKKAGIAVPKDVGVIGFDNQELCTLISPMLTTIDNPFYDIGKSAAQKLIQRLKGEDVLSESFPSRLILRESA